MEHRKIVEVFVLKCLQGLGMVKVLHLEAMFSYVARCCRCV